MPHTKPRHVQVVPKASIMWSYLVLRPSVAAVAVIFSIVVTRILKTILIWRRIKFVPGPPADSLILGNTGDSKCPDRHSVISKLSEKYGAILRRRLLDQHVIQGQLFGKSVASAFNTSNMKAQFPNIRLACGQLIDILKSLDGKTAVDMDSALCRESLDVIGRVGFGRDLGATRNLSEGDGPGQAMAVTNAALFEAEHTLLDPLRGYKIWRKDVRAGTAATKEFHKVMQSLVKSMRTETPDPSSIAAHLLEIKDPSTGKPLDDKRLLPEVSTLFMAGFETTGHTAAWVVFAVSQHPEVEAGIVKKLRGLGLLATSEAPDPRPIQWDDIPQLHYLTATIKETMRLYPVAGGATYRHSKSGKDVALCGGNFILPGGVDLHMPIAAVHHAKDVWDEPYTFKPERFLEDGAEDAKGVPLVSGRKPQRFMPFSQGSRDSVGQTLARLNLTATLAQLYGNFSFQLAPKMGGAQGVEASRRTAITLSCDKGMWMNFGQRVQ
ncbi:g6460 [Coccomyxa viridis]|uniref:G6460 protein n=1 Tax=Coccomyxa viridis TaxID=1274662 RepID=A0ABP1FWP3_9CHLO